jgi:hypothetical protein
MLAEFGLYSEQVVFWLRLHNRGVTLLLRSDRLASTMVVKHLAYFIPCSQVRSALVISERGPSTRIA